MRVRYQTFEFGTTDIHVRSLRDRQQQACDISAAEKLGVSPASWALFGVVWPSGELLAQLMCDIDISGKRILEVGCGIGLASLVLNSRGADISATDYHPEAGNFMLQNTRLNHSAEIPFVRAEWRDNEAALGEFDLIIGSDLLYEPDHSEDLPEFIDQHANTRCEIIIVDPGRGLYPRFSINMIRNGFDYQHRKMLFRDHMKEQFKAHILTYTRNIQTQK